jgi:protocatechuate 3,4-dioxygenase beta subunit/5-hydroxyisourate hydrolase-like protein (transthyretin family)
MKKRTVALMLLLGIAATWTALRAQATVSLVEAVVTPATGVPGEYAFSVKYLHPDDLPPATPGVHLYIETTTGTPIPGSPFTLSTNDSSPVYSTGVVFSTTVSLPAGSYKHRFTASDGGPVVTLGPLDGPLVNTPPTLSGGSVTPASGPSDTLFEYRVTYTDADGHAPDFVRAIIDGSQELLLTRADAQSYETGSLFTGKTASAPGFHSFYFEASDGYVATPVLLKDTGDVPFAGPVNGVKFVGQVTNAATGDPVSGIMISTGSTYTYTDAGGNYTLFGQEGSYELLAYPPVGQNLLVVKVNVSVAVGDEVTRDFALPAGGVLEGVVRDPDLAPVEGVAVRACHLNGTLICENTTDAQGRYTLTRIPGGNVLLIVTPKWDSGYVEQKFLVATVAGQAVTKDVTLARGAVVRCAVKDASDNPVPNARVSLYGALSAATSYTDTEGTCTFSRVESGGYEVQVQPPAEMPHLRMQTRFVEFAVNQTYDLEFVLSQSGVLKGTVRDSGENAVESAKVMAQLITGGSYAEAHTDSDGSYRLEGLISGTYQVTVMPHGESTLLPVQRNGVIVRDGEEATADFILEEGGAVKGFVTDPTGTAVSGAAVVVYTSSGTRVDYTDDEGFYRVAGMPQGTWEMRIDPPADSEFLSTRRCEVRTYPGQETHCDISLKVGATLKVNVTIDGEPVRGASVSVSPGGHYAQTGPEGIATVARLESGVVRVGVNPPSEHGLAPLSLDGIAVKAGETVTVDAPLKWAGAIMGQVTDAIGDAVAGAKVVLTGNSYEVAFTNSDGMYDFFELRPGSYRVSVEPPDDLPLLPNARNVYLGPDEAKTVELVLAPSGVVTGAVLDAMGDPVYGATVILRGLEPEFYREAWSEWDGGFRFTGVPRGVYELVAGHIGGPKLHGGLGSDSEATGGMAAVVSNVSVTPGATVTHTLQLPAIGALTGIVFRPDGQRFPDGAVVRVRYVRNYETHMLETMTGSSGDYWFPQLPAGPVDLEVLPPGAYLTQAIKGVMITPTGETRQDVTLDEAPGPGVIHATVTVEGAPLANASVDAYRISTSYPAASATTDAQGNATLGNLSPGTYSVTVRAPADANALESTVGGIVVAGGATAEVSLALPRGGTVEGVVTDPAGIPVQEGRVTLTASNESGQTYSVYTATDGSYRIASLPPGVYDMLVQSGLALAAPKRITGLTVSSGQVVRQDVQLTVGATLRGVVTDPAGRGVGGAEVELSGSEGSETLTTDSQGAFSRRWLMPGAYRISVLPPSGTNLLPVYDRTVVLQDDTVTQHDITLPAGRVLEGYVVDGEGKPVAGAWVHVSAGDTYGYSETDQAGFFRVEGLSGSTAQVTVSPPDGMNLLPGSLTGIHLNPGGATQVEVVLQSGCVFSGVVTFKGGPVSGAWVALRAVDGSGESGESEWITDRDGRFRFAGVKPGSYLLAVCPPYEPEIDAGYYEEYVAISQGTTGMERDVELPVEGVLTGFVMNAFEEPITDGSVIVLDARGQTRGEASIDDRGRFRVGQLATGRYTLVVSVRDAANRDLLSLRFTGILVTAGEETEYPVVVPGAASLSGKVTDSEGHPVAGATVRLVANGNWIASATSEADGTYELRGLMEGTYSIQVQPPDDRSLEYQVVNGVLVSGTATRDLILGPEAVVTLKVTDASGTPVSGASVRLRASDIPVYFFEDSAVTNLEGEARIGQLPAGLYQLEVVPPPNAEARQLKPRTLSGIRVPRGQEVPLGTVSLGASGAVRGLVTDPAGQPAPGVPVRATGPAGSGEALTDSEGNYRIDGLPAGLYQVVADPSRESGWLPRSVSGVRITAGEAVEKNLSLAAGASLSGRVTDKSGTPVIGAHVTLQHGDGTSVSIDTWAGGEYSMTGLRPGTYLLSVSPPSGLNLLTVAIADVRIAPAENVTRDVELPGGAILQGVVRDADGSPVPYPRLQLRNGKDETWSVLGNAEGAYSFQGLRAGRYDLVAAPTRLGEIRPAPAFMPSILVTEGGTVAQDLVLPTGGTLVVKVTDAAGNPVPDASLELTVDEPLVFKDAWRSTTTDESGEARFTELYGLAGGYERLGLPSCVATVMVEPPSGVLTPGKLENVRVQAGQETEASIVLPAGGTITGRIEDASGAGVRGVFVYMPETEMPAPKDAYSEGPEFVAVSDSHGVYRVSGVPAGTHTLVFDPGEANPLLLEQKVTGVQVAPGAMVTRDVVLDRGAVLSGLVTESTTGFPVPEATVTLYRPGETSGAPLEETAADSEGKYLLGGVSPGTYEVVVRGPNYLNLAPAHARLSLTLEQEVTHNVALLAGGSIAGVIRDEAGEPVPGVTVETTGSYCVSDLEGAYRLERLATGTYDLSLSPPAHSTFGSQRITGVSVTAGETTTRDFVLRRAGEVKGRVTTTQGEPVSGATVMVAGIQDALTDSDGNYHMGGVPAGSHSVTVTPHEGANLLPARRDGVAVIAGQAAVADFTLDPTSMLSGTITDALGAGVEGAQIRVIPSERGDTGKLVTADSAGRYLVLNLAPGRYDVTVAPPVGRPELLPKSEYNVVIARGEARSLDFSLGEGGTITGFVRDQEGAPLAGKVHLIGVGPDATGAPVLGGLTLMAEIGPDGRYTLTGVPAGSFILQPELYSSQSLLSQQARVTVAAGQVVEHDFVLARGGVVAGRVVGPTGDGVRARVRIVHPGLGEARAFEAQSDAAGYYRVTAIPPGVDYTVIAEPLEGLNLIRQVKPATVVDGQETVVNFQLAAGAVLTGHVTDSGGNPLEDVCVNFRGVDSGRVYTDEAGAYEIKGLAEGAYDLYFAPPVKLSVVGQIVRGITVTAATPSVRDVQLAAAGRIEGIVQSKTGEPIGGITIQLYGSGTPAPRGPGEIRSVTPAVSLPGSDTQWDRVNTGADGRFVFSGLPAGHFTLVTEKPSLDGLAPGEAQVDLGPGGTAAVTVVTPPAARIAGVVRGPAGTPLAGVVVRIDGPHVAEGTATDAGGRYGFAGLAPGTYTLSVKEPYGEGAGTRSHRVDVAEGANVTQDISLATTGSIGGVVRGPLGPLFGATVRLRGLGQDDLRTTAADGSFLFDYLPAGVFQIEIHPGRGDRLNRIQDELVLAPGEALRREFVLPAATGSISGEVRFKGTLMAPILVALFEAGPDSDPSAGPRRSAPAATRGWAAIDESAIGKETPFAQCHISEPGPFTLEGVPDGQYHVFAVMDLNQNDQVDPGEPVGKFGKPNAVFVRNGSAVTGVHLVLQVPFAELDLSLGRVTPQQVAPGGTLHLALSARGADRVEAEVFDAANGTSVGIVELADDGAHNDGTASDGLYAATFVAPAVAGDYVVDFRARDAQGNWTVHVNGAGFTTAPFQKRAPVLLLNVAADLADLRIDAQGNVTGGELYAAPLRDAASVESYYAEALSAAGVTFDVWRTICRGPIDPGVLSAYAGPDSVVVVAWPYQVPEGIPGLDGEIFAQFLDAGGRLFVSGQDVAWDAEGDDPYRFDPVFREYLGVGLVTGKASFALTGRDGDLLSDGLRFRVSGGEGANNQSSPDGIVALPPAQPIFHYEEDAAAHTRAPALRRGNARVLFPQARARRKPGRAFSTKGDGPLCGGLRLDNGRYKAVYLAFGLEAIADAQQRALLMRRSLEFLTSPLSMATKIEASASPTTLPADGFSEAVVTASVADASGAPVPDGTLVSFRGYNASVPASARTTGGQATVTVRAGTKPGPMTVAITSGAALGNVVLNGTAAPAGVVGARSLGETMVEVIFDRPMEKASVENLANYTITPALAISAAVQTSEPSRVVLTTAAQIGIPYQVTVAGVHDASGGPLGARVSAIFTGSGPMPVVTLSATPTQILGNGKEGATITARVTAPDGSPVGDGMPVDFTASLGTVQPAQALTAGGEATTVLTAPNAGTSTVTATAGHVQATVEVEVLDASPAAIALTATPTRVVANGTETATLTATVTDLLGRPMDDVAVTFETDLGMVLPGTATTVAGQAGATVSSTTPGTATITARTANGKSASVTVEFLAGGEGGVLTLTADPKELPADGVSVATLAITLVDAEGKPAPDGTVVTLETDSGSVPASVTTSEGKATATYTAGTRIGTATITATAGQATHSVQLTLKNPTAQIAGQATAVLLPSDGTSTTGITFTLTDGAGRPVPDGVPVSVAATLGAVAPNAITTTEGSVKVTFTAGTEPGTALVTATSGDASTTVEITLVQLGVPVAVQVVAEPAALLGDGTSTARVTATVTDVLGQPVPDGTPVQFAASLGVIEATATTAGGQATVTYTAAQATGTATITATAGAATGSIEITLAPAALAEGTIATADGSALPEGTVVELRDASGVVHATATANADGTFRVVSHVTGVFDLAVLPPAGSGWVPVLVPDLDLANQSGTVLPKLSVQLHPQPQLAPGPGLAMITMPFAFRDGAVESVLGDPDAVLYWYDSAAKRYQIAGIDGVPPAAPGRGFWAKPRRGGTPYGIAEPAILPAQDQPYTLPLAKGWQVIGSPFVTGSITLSQVKVLLPGSETPVPLGDPATANLVRGYLWTYNGSTYDLVSATPEGKATTIAPYQGYWIRTLVDGVRLVLSPPSGGGPPMEARQRTASAGWRAQIEARVAGRAQGACTFGVGPTAYTIDAPPPPSGHAEVRWITPGGGRAAVSVLEEGTPASWSFEVDSAGVPEGEEITVAWPGLGAVPRDTRLVLVDEQTGRRWQMRTTACVSFRAGSAPYRFRIEAQKATGALVSISGITLTPVRGTGRSIGYVVSTDATTSITIKSPAGQTLAHVVTGRAVSQGRNEAYWDGRDFRGVPVKGLVLVEITATTGEGATVRAVRPAMLVE